MYVYKFGSIFILRTENRTKNRTEPNRLVFTKINQKKTNFFSIFSVGLISFLWIGSVLNTLRNNDGPLVVVWPEAKEAMRDDTDLGVDERSTSLIVGNTTSEANVDELVSGDISGLTNRPKVQCLRGAPM